MTQEEKLNMVREWYSDAETTWEERFLLERVFPGIKASDESIRGRLGEILRACHESGVCPICASEYETLQSWLGRRDSMESADNATGDDPAARETGMGRDAQEPAWGEEDESMFDGVVADIRFTKNAHDRMVNQVVYEKEITWLGSLRERLLRGYTCNWKPTDEQITSLRWMLNKVPYCRHKEEVSGLLDQITNL